jgi:hypothetical protein
MNCDNYRQTSWVGEKKVFFVDFLSVVFAYLSNFKAQMPRL